MRKFIVLFLSVTLIFLAACQSSEPVAESAVLPEPTLGQPVINTAVPPTNTPPPPPVIEEATATS
ncbi:MAG: hypothetical protein WAS33_24755, partial [Candidatus Promineifilaceae bacterium]